MDGIRSLAEHRQVGIDILEQNRDDGQRVGIGHHVPDRIAVVLDVRPVGSGVVLCLSGFAQELGELAFDLLEPLALDGSDYAAEAERIGHDLDFVTLLQQQG